jgi:hypothetical protein
MYDPYEELVKMTKKKNMIHKIKSIPIVNDKNPPKSGKSRKTTAYRIDDIREENSKEPDRSPKLKSLESGRRDKLLRCPF